MADRISPEYANWLWSSLVEWAGASAHDYAREAFVNYAIGREDIPEYRFGGALGMGGKIRLYKGKKPFVFCYPEDETEYRRGIIKATNAKLAKGESK